MQIYTLKNRQFIMTEIENTLDATLKSSSFAANSGGNTVNTNLSFNIAERTICTWKVMKILSMSCKKTFSN